MSLTRRVIVCLDVDAGRVVKGIRFRDLRDVGDPVAMAVGYERAGADEIVFLDVSASVDGRATTLDVVRATAASLHIPLTVGGGVRTLNDLEQALRAGADKVAVNTAAVERPALLTEAADHFGSQCVVASIDAAATHTGWCVHVRGGRDRTSLEAVAWARRCAQHGAGEILLTSVDRDGGRSGYDLALTAAVSSVVTVPVIASGGAGAAEHLVDAITSAGADAVLVAGILHDSVTSIAELKRAMARHGIPVRLAA
jgi:cyclase